LIDLEANGGSGLAQESIFSEFIFTIQKNILSAVNSMLYVFSVARSAQK
jgi:hypothetical protein